MEIDSLFPSVFRDSSRSAANLHAILPEVQHWINDEGVHLSWI